MLDKNLQFSDAQAVTSTADSTNVIDTLAAGDAVAPGARVVVQTQTTCTDTSSDATLTVELKTSADDSTYVTLFSTGALAFATYATAGTVVADLVIPNGVRRYLKLVYTVASGPLTAGKFDAHVVLDSAKIIDRGL